MDKILNLDNVDQYNSLYGLETLNPLVSVIDLNKATRQMDYVHWNYGVYALYLKLEKACDIKYGRRSYDYQEGTVVCFAPGQTTETTLTTDRVQLNVLGSGKPHIAPAEENGVQLLEHLIEGALS